mmetsp:Transcript_10128/g.21351  ORF Transcript_10128/g.21351 Transcript_10128/m.21351 type:complete len:258 (+) Transcript_10128:113-886(+)
MMLLAILLVPDNPPAKKTKKKDLPIEIMSFTSFHAPQWSRCQIAPWTRRTTFATRQQTTLWQTRRRQSQRPRHAYDEKNDDNSSGKCKGNWPRRYSRIRTPFARIVWMPTPRRCSSAWNANANNVGRLRWRRLPHERLPRRTGLTGLTGTSTGFGGKQRGENGSCGRSGGRRGRKRRSRGIIRQDNFWKILPISYDIIPLPSPVPCMGAHITGACMIRASHMQVLVMWSAMRPTLLFIASKQRTSWRTSRRTTSPYR